MALFRQGTRRTAEPSIQVCEMSDMMDTWFLRRGTRDLEGLLRRLRLEATWKTAPTVASRVKNNVSV